MRKIAKILTALVFLMLYSSSYAQGISVAGFFAGFVSVEIPYSTFHDFHVKNNSETFILVNMDFLRSDIATGAGDTIDALAVLMEVKDASAFGKRLQANFEAIYPSYDVDYVHVSNAISSFALVDSVTLSEANGS